MDDVVLPPHIVTVATPSAVMDKPGAGAVFVRPLHPFRPSNRRGAQRLSYREFPHSVQVVRRIAAILLLGPAHDASYQAILPTAVGLPPAIRPRPAAAEYSYLQLRRGKLIVS
jgi:hypothetical protein